ncbi:MULTISPECIES: helix-turn-helix domain-containing protein [unclassified Streptomyces]|uniref:helix-turn-helix domain-containing protein n=1 Tax=unclassified Streptomyces TaxID=2593676 RepID=UPI002023ED43|nr:MULTISPECIES: helix-turn-helix domain-containing protein [unclassified Streptomyces]MCX4550543.1 helix-turn-helix domain-containing protein [Streptomyces sp. NBC_01500]WSC21990.1 helix-turn-helix domain-containing protein [Streptomyces sp. NBC_01766]
MSADSKPRGPRHNLVRRPHRKGDERALLRADLRRAYDGGAAIRALATEHDLSYGLTRALLLEAGVKLRSRRGSRVARELVDQSAPSTPPS